MINSPKILFENIQQIDILSNGMKYSKESIITSIHELATQIINELKVTSLKNIIIGEVSLYEKVLGEARMNSQKSEIKISYKIAVNLVNNHSLGYEQENKKDALATFYHEFYHILDYEKVWRNLSKQQLASCQLNDVQCGYDIWTEIYATYAAFNIKEQARIYNNFEYVFLYDNENISNKKYHTARLLGYFLREEHSSTCDELIEKYLHTYTFKQVSDLLVEMLNSYPNITAENLVQLNVLIEKSISNNIDFDKLKPIDIATILQKAKNRNN